MQVMGLILQFLIHMHILHSIFLYVPHKGTVTESSSFLFEKKNTVKNVDEKWRSLATNRD
jgi:hypothetical protein